MSTPVTQQPAPLSMRTQQAIALTFFTLGATVATWATRIPDIKDRLELTDGGVSVAIFALSIGAFSTLFIAGSLIDQFGSRNLMLIGATFFMGLLPVAMILPSLPLVMIVLYFVGMGNTFMGVSINVQSVAADGLHPKPIQVRFHAMFSIGALCGALTASVLAGLPAVWHLLLVEGVLLTLTAWAWQHIIKPETVLATMGGKRRPPRFALPTKSLLGIGAIIFCGAMIERSMAEWTTIYMRDTLHAEYSVATLGFAAFSLMMGLGRLAGDSLNSRFGAVQVVRYGALLTVFGLGLALTFDSPVMGIIGFALVGAGQSSIIPLVFSAAGRTPGLSTGAAIAGVSIFGHASLVVTLIIGQISDFFSLRAGLLVLVVGALTIVYMAGQVWRSDAAYVPEGVSPSGLEASPAT